MKRFGLIGQNISYSRSKELFDKHNFEDAEYQIYDITREQLNREFLLQFDGLNVTTPYKKEVCQYLDEVTVDFDSVNCIINDNGKLIGYNTDLIALQQILRKYIQPSKNVLLCGNGGVSETIQHLLAENKINHIILVRGDYKPISRYGIVRTYEEYKKVTNTSKVNMVINATIVGSPKAPGLLDLPYDMLCWVDFAFDLIYNPEETEFIKKFKSYGVKTSNGLKMLELQAEASYKLWQLL